MRFVPRRLAGATGAGFAGGVFAGEAEGFVVAAGVGTAGGGAGTLPEAVSAGGASVSPLGSGTLKTLGSAAISGSAAGSGDPAQAARWNVSAPTAQQANAKRVLDMVSRSRQRLKSG
jgi:hypothetical protein